MRQGTGLAASALLVVSLLPAIALAASAEDVGGVTILRGAGTGGRQTIPAEIGTGSSSAPAAARIEQSAEGNAVRTGGVSPGGYITSPPPSGGR